MIKHEFRNEHKIKAILEETEELRLEYEYLNSKVYDRNGKRYVLSLKIVFKYYK